MDRAQHEGCHGEEARPLSRDGGRDREANGREVAGHGGRQNHEAAGKLGGADGV